MKQRCELLTLVLAMTLLFAACASSRTAGEQLDDAVITSRIEAKLAVDPDVNPFEIDVDVLEGVVHLRGMVETARERSEAERLARDTQGVVNVVNHIALGDPTIAENLTDARIASMVKAKLASDPEINPFDIDVDAELGVVTLDGIVRTMEQKAEAGDLARGTRGVKRVINSIEVRPGA